MADSYLSFLRSPSASALASNASLHYITTTTSIHEPATIIKHLQAQEKQVKKKSETVLSTIESSNGVVLETETTFEFLRGGGTILPQMDDNMLADMLVVCPMVHIVQLDNSGKISQIRLHWDQGTMLRQVEAIGRSGRNWPIRDGSAMTRMVKDSVRAASDNPLPTRGGAQSHESDEVVITARSQSNRTNENKDFHNRLFATGDDGESESSGNNNNNNSSVSTRVSAKPAPRQWDELFASDEALSTPAPNRNTRSPSPGKAEGNDLKAGAGKNFGENRLFDRREGGEREPSQERRKVDGARNGQSFVLGHGEDAPPMDGNRPASAKAMKQMNKWDFEDFTTPEKVAAKVQPEQERHIGPGYDEDEVESPQKRPIVHAPRPDADAHFKMTDASSPAAERNFKNIRADAFENHCDSGTAGYGTNGNKQPLGTIKNTNNSRRGNEFNNPHFSVNGNSPNTQDENANAHANARGTTASKDHNEMQPHWRMEDTPEKPKKIAVAGNGIGGRKGAESLWDLNHDEDFKQPPKIYKTSGNPWGAKKGAESLWDTNTDEPPAKSAGIRTFGNGSGGRRDQQLGYDIAESDDTQFADARNSAFSSAPKSRNKAYSQFQPSQTIEERGF